MPNPLVSPDSVDVAVLYPPGPTPSIFDLGNRDAAPKLQDRVNCENLEVLSTRLRISYLFDAGQSFALSLSCRFCAMENFGAHS